MYPIRQKIAFILMWILLISPNIFAQTGKITTDCLYPETIVDFEELRAWNDIVHGGAYDIALNPPSNLFAATYYDGLRLYDAETLEQKVVLFAEDQITGGSIIDWSPDGQYIAIYITPDSGIWVWDIETKQVVVKLIDPENKQFVGLGADYLSIKWSPDGTKLAVVGDLPTQVWDITSEKIIFAPGTSTNLSIRSFADTLPELIAWSPDSSMIALPEGKDLRIWDTKNWGEIQQIHLAEDQSSIAELHAIDWSVQGKLALVYNEPQLQIWNSADWSVDTYILDYYPEALKWSPDGSILAMAGVELNLFDLQSGKVTSRFMNHGMPVQNIEWMPDGQTIFTRSRDGTVYRWDNNSGCVTGYILRSD